MSRRFVEDKSDAKENLSVGGYRDDAGQIHLMDVVRKAEEAIVKDKGCLFTCDTRPIKFVSHNRIAQQIHGSS